MMSDWQLKSTVAQHPIDRKRNGDLCRDLRMYPITSVIHSPNQLLPTIVQAPTAKQTFQCAVRCVISNEKSVLS